jgi:hypothetical protein
VSVWLRLARVVLFVGIVLSPLSAVAATVPMLLACDVPVGPTAMMLFGRSEAGRCGAERPATNDYDAARLAYGGWSNPLVVARVRVVHAYDDALGHANGREAQDEGPIYDAPAAALAAEGAGAAARFAATADRAGVLGKALTSEGTLNTSQTVARQLAGQRGFIPVQSILDTIGSGARIADPQGVAGQFMYRAAAAFNGSEGTLEVLVDEASGQINHAVSDVVVRVVPGTDVDYGVPLGVHRGDRP